MEKTYFIESTITRQWLVVTLRHKPLHSFSGQIVGSVPGCFSSWTNDPHKAEKFTEIKHAQNYLEAIRYDYDVDVDCCIITEHEFVPNPPATSNKQTK